MTPANLIQALRQFRCNGAHGQIIGMESYRIVANGFALECIDEAAERIEELEATLVSRDAEIAELVAALSYEISDHLKGCECAGY